MSRSPGGATTISSARRTSEPVAAHVEKLLATVRERFIPGTHLIRYGEGDWNDSLQPVDPTMRDWMVSSWTVALLFQQLSRYAEVLAPRRPRRAGRGAERARRRDARRLQSPSHSRRHRRGLCASSSRGGDARAAAAPERYAHRPQLFAAADDARIIAGCSRRSRRGTISRSSASICSFPTACG